MMISLKYTFLLFGMCLVLACEAVVEPVVLQVDPIAEEEDVDAPTTDTCNYMPLSGFLCGDEIHKSFCSTGAEKSGLVPDAIVDYVLDFSVYADLQKKADICVDDTGEYFRITNPTYVEVSVQYRPDIANYYSDSSFPEQVTYYGAPYWVTVETYFDEPCNSCVVDFENSVTFSASIDGVTTTIDLGSRFSVEFDEEWLDPKPCRGNLNLMLNSIAYPNVSFVSEPQGKICSIGEVIGIEW